MFSTSFTQEIRSWSWPMLPPWRPVRGSYKASAPKTPRTLSKLSERSLSPLFSLPQFPSIVLSFLCLFSNAHICLPCSQIPYLGFCACEEMGETGVWQLVDPPILPLTHGPNHSFNWREMLTQDWRNMLFSPKCYLFSSLDISLKLLKGQRESQPGFHQRQHAKNKRRNK